MSGAHRSRPGSPLSVATRSEPARRDGGRPVRPGCRVDGRSRPRSARRARRSRRRGSSCACGCSGSHGSTRTSDAVSSRSTDGHRAPRASRADAPSSGSRIAARSPVVAPVELRSLAHARRASAGPSARARRRSLGRTIDELVGGERVARIRAQVAGVEVEPRPQRPEVDVRRHRSPRARAPGRATGRAPRNASSSAPTRWVTRRLNRLTWEICSSHDSLTLVRQYRSQEQLRRRGVARPPSSP